MPNRPEMRKRTERTISGGADVTRILAEVKALDQITEKLTPIRMERMSTGKTSRNVEKEVVPKLNVLIQEMNPGYGLESDEIHHEADADELQIHSMLQRAGAGLAA